MATHPTPSHRPPQRGVLFPVLLIAAGALVLAMNFGLVRADVWLDLVTLWPVLLIGAGLSIMLGGSRVGALLAAGVTLALLAGGALWLQTNRTASSPAQSEAISESAAGLRSAHVTLAPGAAAVHVKALAADSTDLIAGTASAGRGGTLVPNFDRDGATARFELREEGPVLLGFGNVRGRTWDLGLARDVPLALEIDAGVGQVIVDLTDIALTSLDLNLGVGEVIATLPDAGRMDVDVDGGVGSFTLRLPAGLAARIKADAGIGAVDLADGLDKVDDDTWETDGYDDADDRATISIDGGIGAIEVAWVGGAAGGR